MAKGKQAAALFEVISKSRGLHTRNEQKVLDMPRWWFKRKKNPDQPLVSAKVDAPPPQPEAALSEPEILETGIGGGSETPRPRPRPLAIAVDQVKKQISLRLSFTSALIGLLGILAIVGIAVIIGEHMNAHPKLVLGHDRSDDLMAGPKDPSVLDVQSRNSLPVTMVSVDGGGHSSPAGAAKPTFNSPEAPPTAIADGPKRVIHLNYLIVQSYPSEKDANEACACLNQHGVPSTVEKSLKGWNDWFAVVTLKGFSRISNSPEYDQLMAQVTDVGAKFAGKKSFRAFDPHPYQWKEAR